MKDAIVVLFKKPLLPFDLFKGIHITFRHDTPDNDIHTFGNLRGDLAFITRFRSLPVPSFLKLLPEFHQFLPRTQLIKDLEILKNG